MGTPLQGMATHVGHPETPRWESGGHNDPPCPLLSHLLCPTGGSSRACRQPAGTLCTSRTRWGYRPGRGQGGRDTGHTGSCGGSDGGDPSGNRAGHGEGSREWEMVLPPRGSAMGITLVPHPRAIQSVMDAPGRPGDSGQGFWGLCGCPLSLHSLSPLCALTEGQTLLPTP